MSSYVVALTLRPRGILSAPYPRVSGCLSLMSRYFFPPVELFIVGPLVWPDAFGASADSFLSRERVCQLSA